MPAIRSSKGKAPDDNDNNDKGKGKGKAPAAPSPSRPRKPRNTNVEPCEICGVVVSRKSDIARHAKIHASDSEKLPCPWEGCTFSAHQKTNLNTHYRRHTQEKDCICKDDPEKCDFDCVDAASLLRHRKRFHGYIPGSAPRKRDKKTRKKRVPIRVIRGIEGDSPGSASAATLSQFQIFSSTEASTSGSSSSRPFSAEASTSGLSSSRPFSAEASASGSYSSRPFSTGASTSRSSSSRPYSAEASTSGTYSSRPFSAEASASGSSSSRPLSPSESESPTPSPSPPNSLSSSSSSSYSSSSSPSPSPSSSPAASGSQSRQSLLSISPSPLPYYPALAASGSQLRQQSSLRTTYSPADSSGESEVSPTTPITSTFPHEFTQGGPSPAVMTMTSHTVYGRSMMHYHHSLLFAPPIKDYVYVDSSCAFPSEVLDGSWVNSWRSPAEHFDYQDQQLEPVEVVYDTISMENELLSPLFPDKGKEWTEVSMAGSLLGPADGLPIDEEQQASSSSPMSAQHLIHIGFYHQTQISPIAGLGFHGNAYQSHSLPVPSQFPSPTPLEVAVANLDMMMSLDVDNQSYCGYDTGTGDMSSHGFGNMSV